MIAKAARLRPLDEDDAGGSLALLSDTRGQAAVLRAVDTLIDERRPSAHAGEHAMRLLHAALVLLVTAQGADGADALAKLDANGNRYPSRRRKRTPAGGCFSPSSTRTSTTCFSRRN